MNIFPQIITKGGAWKIIITTFTFPPRKDGVSEAAASMAIGFAEKGHEVVVCTGFDPERTNFRPHPRVRVEQFHLETTRHVVRDFPAESRRYQDFLISEQADFVICHCWEIWPTALAEVVFPRLKAKKILVSHGYTTHLWRPRWKPPWGLGVLLYSLPKVISLPWTIRRYDRVVFLSKLRNFERYFDQTVAAATGYPGIRVIPNGTDPNPPRRAAEEFRANLGLKGKLVVLCVANYSPRKNQALAIRAFRRAAIPGSVLVLIGSEFNEYSAQLTALDTSLKEAFPKGQVLFLERQDRLTTMAGFSACDLFFLAAEAETQPISILEAMAAGKPFLSTDTGSVSELPGGVVVSGEAGLAEQLAALCADPNLRRRLGEEGRRSVVEYFAIQKVREAQNRLIEELLPENHLV